MAPMIATAINSFCCNNQDRVRLLDEAEGPSCLEGRMTEIEAQRQG